MKVHEYQAKEIFSKYNIPIPKGKVAFTPDEAKAIAEELGGLVVVKAQIHAGGRGKGGGVKLAKDVDEAVQHANDILGMTLVTHQTGPKGKEVRKVLIEDGADIEREIYLAIVLDRETERPVIIASKEGGMSIEEVAATNPEAIHKVFVDPDVGLMPFQTRELGFKLGFSGDTFKQGTKLISNLYKLFISEDASLVEINPLIVTKSGDVVALDAKINFDDNASFRHPYLAEYRDLNEEDPLETEAHKFDLNYIKLDGNVGCMVNGAGLAMATMDIIKFCGGEPANFLDVGGGASAEGVENAFKILLADPDVKAVLVNIFGGMIRCDMVAKSIVKALDNLGEVKVPVVVRLDGTNAAEGLEVLKNSGMDIRVAPSFHEAAQMVSDAAGVEGACPVTGGDA